MRVPIRRLGGALLLLALMLGVLEGVLRLLPLERWEPPFLGDRSYPIFVRGTGANAGRFVTNEHYRGQLNFQTFAIRKPPGTFRVFVLGGSAAFGWPYGDRNGFTGILRRALETSIPGRVEIVNAAGMSYGSHRVLDFLREIVSAFVPDLVIVYSGNNEYVERNVLAPEKAADGLLGRTRSILRRSAVYRSLRLLLYRVAPKLLTPREGVDLTNLRGESVRRGFLRRSPEIDRKVLANYRRNLGEMARSLEQAGVPGLFCTVPVNLADWPPVRKQLPFPSPEALHLWRRALEDGRAALARGETAAALERLAAAGALAPEDTWTRFWHGKALLREQSPAASEFLIRAKDEDPAVLRALSSFNLEIRALPASHRGVSVLDLEGALSRESPGGVPGEDLFLDYVHETQKGHRLIALALLPPLAERSPEPFSANVVEWLIRQDRGYGDDKGVRARETFARAMSYEQSERWEDAERAFKEVARDLPDFSESYSHLGNIAVKRGDAAEGLRFYERAAALSPRNVPIMLGLAQILQATGRDDRAAALFREALYLNPLNAMAHEGLARIALARGDLGEAERHFIDAEAQGFETSLMRRAWGDLARSLGRFAEARRHWERALALDPLDDAARQRLAELPDRTR